jgi:fucose 4-O-acetylase-like acetyltransferase
VPIGQATLYVFIVHVYLVLVVTQVAKMGLAPVHILAHTALHAALLAIVWLMVRFKVLYRWIPR